MKSIVDNNKTPRLGAEIKNMKFYAIAYILFYAKLEAYVMYVLE